MMLTDLRIVLIKSFYFIYGPSRTNIVNTDIKEITEIFYSDGRIMVLNLMDPPVPARHQTS